jgi:predicted N-acyltransferase
VAEHEAQPIGISLIGLHLNAQGEPQVAYGRYWGALERVDCLHFEACYYQPLIWCLQNGVQRFEGGAQGEHKLARGFEPVQTQSAHWLAHPAFADAVERFLEQERTGIERYMVGLHSPFRPEVGD